MTTLPWHDPDIVDAVIDGACRIRDDTTETMRMLAAIPHEELARLTAAALVAVDVDRPTRQLFRFSGSLPPADRMNQRCPVGHLYAAYGYHDRDGQHCWQCDLELAKRERTHA